MLTPKQAAEREAHRKFKWVYCPFCLGDLEPNEYDCKYWAHF